MPPQKVALTRLTLMEQQLKKHSYLPDQGGYNPYPAVGAYNSYCYSSTVISGTPDCSPSGNPVEQVNSPIHGQTFADQVTGDI